jgi:hypothetical protein
MKLRLVSIAAVAALAGQAQALTLADIDAKRAAGTLIEVTMSGATALSATTGGLFNQNCVAGTLDTYLNNATLFAGETINGNLVKAYSCQLVSTNNDFGTAYNGKFVLFQKSDQGGSGNGVFPVATNSALPFLNVSAATCDQTTKVCSTLSNKKPDGGVSDVAPIGFNPALNRPLAPIDFSANADVKNSDFAANSVKGVIQTVFGLAVSAPLYTALQVEQGTTGRPSIPRAIAASMLSAGYDASLGWSPLLSAANIGTATQINICRRVNGSGTQTSANRFFLEYGANGAGLIPADNANNSEFANAIANVSPDAGGIMVYEGSSTGNVRSCLEKANDVAAFAIGHISLENAETAKWKFVKIDGVEPSRDNAKRGHYEYVFESTIQTAKIGNSAAGRAFMGAFTLAAQKPANLNALSAANQAGVLSMPTATGCPATFTFVPAGTPGETANQKFCSRVSRANPADPVTLNR